MDKNIIKKFAVNARNKLRNSVKVELNNLGISADDINDELSISTQDKKYYFDENHPVEGIQIDWRQDIVKELNNRGYKENGKQVFNDFVEEVAYTWFNRIIAIRFMEVNNYLPSRVRVLSNEEDKNEPEIMDQALLIEDDLGGYSDKERDLINQALDTKAPDLMDDLYAMLFIKQCDALEDILPGLFEKTKDYFKLLFVPHYSRGIIPELVNDIPESYFNVSQEGQVQIIGWLYQYYNTEPKDKAFKKKKYNTSDIPAVTQLFTPDWIVKYMVENSLGRYWIDILHSKGDPRSEKEIADSFNWEYYMPSSAKNSVNIDESLSKKEITDIKFWDPAMGSGHILIYAFDVLMQIYTTEGYTKREATKLILEDNLFGLDIDKRAYQLSYFALMMKARENNRRIFRNQVQVHLYDVPVIHYSAKDYTELVEKSDLDKNTVIPIVENLVSLFKYGDDLGSIIKIDPFWNLNDVEKLAHHKEANEQLSFLTNSDEMQNELLGVVRVAKILQQKFDISVTNPPYMGGGKMDPPLKKYAQKHYPNGKADMFSVFIELLLNRTNLNGYIGMITQHSWMFLSNFERLRKEIQNHTIINMAHLGTRAFDEIGGEVVQTTTFILQGQKNKGYFGNYERLVNYKSQDLKGQNYLKIKTNKISKNLYQINQENFKNIPGEPVAYWASNNIFRIFKRYPNIYQYSLSPSQNVTGNNKRFLRSFWEINKQKINKKNLWIFYAKGGNYRKWYGNLTEIINWSPEARKIYKYGDGKHASQIINEQFWYKKGITWGLITSNKSSFRVMPMNATFDKGGTTIIIKNEKNYNLILSFLNSKVLQKLISFINPTINFQLRDISLMPLIDNNVTKINTLTAQTLKLSKQDWDAFETSWDFNSSPLILQNSASLTLKSAYQNWVKEAEDRFNQLKSNEEELNKIFIDLYGLQDELTPDEEDKDVSVRKADQLRDIKAFLSYFIGCVFGRYSLDEDGLIYAGGEWNPDKYKTFNPNKDNIILFTDRNYFDDDRDIIVRLKEFLTDIYKPDSLSENMGFIAQTLDPKKFEKGESSEQIIRNYFINDFYKDHDKIYQKRPIYWEFNSGRNKGFKALMYLHRYSKDELAMVRTYLHDLQPAMQDLINIDQKLLDQASTAHEKSQYRRTITSVNKQLNELIQYDQILDHLSQNPVDLDLDDGVLVNHEKLQQGEKLLTKL